MARLLRIVLVLAACALLLGAGGVAGYFVGEDSDRTTVERPQADSSQDREAVTALERDRRRTAEMLTEVCRTATKLRSAYTREVIGHAERCIEGDPSVDTLVRAVCTDVTKATRTAHLPEGSCRP